MFLLAESLLVLAFVTGHSASLPQPTTSAWTQIRQEAPREIKGIAPLRSKAPTDKLNLSIALPFANPAGAEAMADAVSDPKSASYRHFLAPEEVGQKFGLPSSAVQEVSDYLKSAGLTIKLVAKNRLSILAEGTVAQAQAAFKTSIAEFSLRLPGSKAPTTCFAATTAPSVPSRLSRYVRYIGGLEDVIRPKPASLISPAQLLQFYDTANLFYNGFTGSGRTIGISNYETYYVPDIASEYEYFGLPLPPGGVETNVYQVQIDGKNGTYWNGSDAEADLDIQCSLAMAPLCTLIIYDDAGGSDPVSVLTAEADANQCDIITESYGFPAGYTSIYSSCHAIHLSMTLQGITYLCAAGDKGAGGVVTSPYPDDDPEVLSVGGSSIAFTNAGYRTAEVVWDDSTGAGGGGWATEADPWNRLPSWQVGFGVPTGVNARLIPDVALNADIESGYEIFLGGVFQPSIGEYWGGTSCASPTMAGDLAVVEQYLIQQGALTANSKGHYRLGRIQNLIYSYNGDPTVFYDITQGYNGNLPDGNPSYAGPGWDFASGWGAMDFIGFANRILATPVLAGVTVSPASVTGGDSANGTVTLTAPALSGGVTVTLKSSNANLTVPSEIGIPQGSTTGSFAVNAAAVSGTVTSTITATFSGVSKSFTVTATEATVSSISVSPASVTGGTPLTGSITLNGAAPKGGASVKLSASSPSVVVPGAAVVPAGSSSVTYKASTKGVAAPTVVTITATFGKISQVCTLTLQPAVLSGVSVTPGSAVGGSSTKVTGKVQLSGVAPTGGCVVTTTSSNASYAAVPATVKIAAGASSASFTISTKSVPQSEDISLGASYQGVSQQTTLTLQPPNLTKLTLSPTSVKGSSSTAVTGAATISTAAPSGGLIISLSSSNPAMATVPTTVTIPAGKTTGTFKVGHAAVSAKTSVTISASFGGALLSANLSLTP